MEHSLKRRTHITSNRRPTLEAELNVHTFPLLITGQQELVEALSSLRCQIDVPCFYNCQNSEDMNGRTRIECVNGRLTVKLVR